MAHVVGQDQEAFDQRCRKHHDHREWDVADQIPEPTTDGGQPEKRDDRRHRGRHHRQQHAFGRVFGGLNGPFTQLAGAEICMFANDDGIIHHDAQRDDQPKERDHVDRQAKRIHQRDGCKHGRWYARSHPERGAQIEEQEQQAQHKAQPHQPVIHQQIEAARDRLGPGADQLHRDALRHRELHLGHNLFDLRLNVDGVPCIRAVHPN